MTKPQVAFLGLGAIGTPMAAHLAATCELVVWNRTSEKAAAFGQRYHVSVAATPAEAAQHADVVITCLPTSGDVDAVVTGEHGLLQGLQAGAVLVDCTSGHPVISRQLAARLKSRGVSFLDAPVSGGVVGAESGTLTVMCGGEAAVFDRVRPVLEMFGKTVVLCGPVGSGHALKAVNNALLALHIWSTAEGLAILQKMGIDSGLALEVINSSSGRSNASMNLFPERVLTRAFPSTFRLALLDKDARIAADLAQETGVPADLLALGSQLFGQARAELGETADHVEAVKVVEERAGVTIHPG